MNILVTGAAGFLGSHLVKHHLQLGDHVWGVDDFSSSNDNSRHFSELLKEKKFDFKESNIIEEQFLWAPSKIDLIYNFACPASPPIYQSMPIHTLMTCVVGTSNVLTLARNRGSIVVHASTSEVYGNPKVSPQPENYLGEVNSYGPRSCYDEGKRAAEALCFDYLNMFDVDVRLVRIFNTYGPNMDPDDGRVVTNFVKQALSGEKLTIYGDGLQTRSFCYVDDLIRGITKLATLQSNPRTPVNIGNPHEFTMIELASAVLGEVRSRPYSAEAGGIVFRPLPVDDPMQRKPDVLLAKKLLDWEPQVSLEQGLKHMVSYMKEISR